MAIYKATSSRIRQHGRQIYLEMIYGLISTQETPTCNPVDIASIATGGGDLRPSTICVRKTNKNTNNTPIVKRLNVPSRSGNIEKRRWRGKFIPLIVCLVAKRRRVHSILIRTDLEKLEQSRSYARPRFSRVPTLGFHSRDETAMLVCKTMAKCSSSFA